MIGEPMESTSAQGGAWHLYFFLYSFIAPLTFNGYGPEVDLVMLSESDISPEVLALDLGGHYEEIYAINSRDWASRSTALVADYGGGRELD